MAMTSATAQSGRTSQRGNCWRMISGRLRPVAMPSLAERLWISMAMMLAYTTTQSSL